jgi:fibronectin type 3 domain-containing protein
MENRKGTPPLIGKISVRPIFSLLFSIFFFMAGCGAPGEPVPPSPPVAVAIADLSARQAGDGVELTFTLPTNSISGGKLAAPPAVEILRGSLKTDGSPDSKSFRVVYTIPGALVENYRSEGHVRFTDPISLEETKAHPGGTVAYTVRTRASQKRASADSNVVTVRMFPVPERITVVEARVTDTAIELSWPVPAHTSAGDPLSSAIAGYRVYRAEINAAASATTAQGLAQNREEPRFAPLAPTESNNYRDTSFSFDHTYVYMVRSVIQAEGKELESSDSQPVTVTPRDTFPPASPQGLVAAVLPGSTAGTVLVDLSWSINLETDLAGYHVYKSEQEGTRGQLVTADLLPTPAIRDTSVEPGRRYWYTVTAVDRAGNESAPSAPLAVDVTQPSSQVRVKQLSVAWEPSIGWPLERICPVTVGSTSSAMRRFERVYMLVFACRWFSRRG